MIRISGTFQIEWAPPWDGAVAEDGELQRAAAERLAKYINEGSIHFGRSGHRPVSKLHATVEDSAQNHLHPRHVIMITVDAELDVLTR